MVEGDCKRERERKKENPQYESVFYRKNNGGIGSTWKEFIKKVTQVPKTSFKAIVIGKRDQNTV
jgi:hypothetical protein